jgi:Xaa-Pro aminopeptidase
MCRNVVIGGKPTNRQRRVHAAILDARDAVRAGIRPGIKASDLFDIGVNVLDKHDLGPAISLVGHGLGLSIHENPCLTAFDHRPLEPGMVINIEPNTEVPGMTMFNVEDTGVVTEDGFDPFSTLTTDLDVLAR